MATSFLPSSNTAQVTRQDRQATGAQPDQTPVGGQPGQNQTGGGGSGTVTQVNTGTGLTGGPITTTGTIAANLASSSVFGVVKVDGTTITASGGVISAPGSSLPWFNVKAYGATGNGSTDDTAAINSAIAALEATFPNPAVPSVPGGVLYFPAGNYKITSVLSTLTGFVQIRGDGWGAGNLGVSQINQTSATDGVFVLTPVLANCGQYIHDLVIIGASSGDGIQFNGSSLLTVCERMFINGFGNGIHQVTGGGATFRNLYIGCTYCLYLENAPNPDDGGCYVTGCTLTPSNTGIYCLVDGMTVTDNQFGGSQYGLAWRVPLLTGGGGGVDLYFANNHCEALSVAAVSILIASGAAAGQFQFVGSEFNAETVNSMNCIEVLSGGGSLSQVAISGNTFECGASNACISLYNTSCIAITGNTFDTNSAGTGIYIDATCSNGYAGAKTNRFQGSGTPITNNGGFDT